MRQRVLAAAAFVTALGTGYVANLDEAGRAPGDDAGLGWLPAAAGGAASGSAGAAGSASWARGNWPEPAADALRAWGQELPLRGEGGPHTPRAMTAAAARVTAPATPVAPASSAPAPEALPTPPWRLIGRVDDGSAPRALLATPQQLLVVAGGDTIEGRWRVELIGAEVVELRALAGGQALRLAWETR